MPESLNPSAKSPARSLSRRAFLLAGVSGLGIAGGLGAFPGEPVPASAQSANALVGLSRLGPNGLQLVLTDGDVTLPPAVPLAEPPSSWHPDPFERLSSIVESNGMSGALSGNRNLHQPQVYFPWAVFRPNPDLGVFRGGTGPQEGDDPQRWSVASDGVPVGVRAVWRKSTPIRTVRTGPRTYASAVRHVVTLALDADLPERADVTLGLPGGLRLDGAIDPGSLSEVIHVCQAGYATSGPKKAYLGAWLGHDQDGRSATTDELLSPESHWQLRDFDTGLVVAEGRLSVAKAFDSPHQEGRNFNGCTIYEADFSSVGRSGRFRLEVPDLGSSFVFPVTSSPYEEVARLAARWYFHQRSGCEIRAPYGEGRVRPRNGHPADGLTVRQSDVRLGRTSEGFTRKASVFDALRDFEERRGDDQSLNDDAWGGWHDAGDWDRRIQHCEAVYAMAQIIELLPSARRIDLNIPESGKTFSDEAVQARKDASDRGDGSTILPDLIHEALWGLSIWRRTQGADGRIIGGVEYSLDGIQGSVSWNPVQTTYAYGAEEWSAYNFAMAAAKLGHVVRTVCGDSVLGGALVSEAAAAWDWAEGVARSNSSAEDEDAASQLFQARLAAAGPLYRATGRQDIRATFEESNPFAANAGGALRNNIAFQAWDYVLAEREGHPADDDLAASVARWSAGQLQREERMGQDYGLHASARFPWGVSWMRFGPGSNWPARRSWLQVLADEEVSSEVRECVLEGMWFGLGCNPSNVSFIQGVGSRVFGDPLLIDPTGNDPIPGHIVFGVAAGDLHDFERKAIQGTLYPADETHWPEYARIFESRRVIGCAEHGMKSNALEWLYASFAACEVLSEPNQL
ncbi:Endoglucanase D precursor [Rubellimicrobium mesophilum DSM 19309]|uniref:Endoglucanase D n=1 Tax=Rubellimicrobium mesophilum DSM 19309 TaxID=442562 RepID=A0A017HMC8_9RHOB|nr:glycoside hydrolase family 9 protein [Rubellimicrobium mesophilum]EYD74934.1 Endoglucanase D precursor [Rubellimicrobium mesophilum DSM 19309]